MLDVVARRHLDGGLWVVPSEHAWSSALPYDWKFSGPTATVPPLVRGLTEGAEHAAVLRESATASAAAPPGLKGAVRVAQQGMPSTRDLAAALAARPVVAQRTQRPALTAGPRPHEPVVSPAVTLTER